MPACAIPQTRRLAVILIKPTTYDDRGFPLRFWRGVLPSNSLAVMYSLTKQAIDSGQLPIDSGVIEVYDDAVWKQRVSDPEALVARHREAKVVVGMVGVQTNQFPRAVDMAKRFQAAGATVVIGGFHVSGSISTLYDGIASTDPKRADTPCPNIMPPEIDQLMRDGIVICHGEAEEIWPEILRDILAGEPKPLYRGGRPDLSAAPLPAYPPKYFDDFATVISTFDTGRGCPFACSFCSIINVQGRSMRHRSPAQIIAMVENLCEQHGEAAFFFTDDNFARNPYWEEILDGLIELREKGLKIGFMIEADLASYRIKNFIPKLARAGCSQVFLGMESVNQESLKAKGKGQNQVKNYQKLCEMLHEYGIAAHVGYIIGFPEDTRESILRDIETLKSIGVDQASFFILTPLPGSEDHVRAYVAGVPMDLDFNKYDSVHAVADHPHMSREELRETLFKCFSEFYRSRQMITALKRLPAANFWGLYRNYLWYRNAALGEGTHPMMAGFISLRDRREIRPGYHESILQYAWREFALRMKYVGHFFREFYIFQHVYFEARGRGEIADQFSQRLENVSQRITKGRDELAGHVSYGFEQVSQRISRGASGLADQVSQGAETVGRRIEQARGWWRHIFRRPSRHWLNDFWIRYGKQKWNLLWNPLWHIRMAPYAFAEVIYTFYFGAVLLKNLATMSR